MQVSEIMTKQVDVGIVSMGDMRRHGGNELAEQAVDRIVEAA